MSKEIENAVENINNQLKPFQAASVAYVLEQLYDNNRNKVLIADEVGLGKTIIAKGVIAKATQLKAQEGKPFHVVYICSNQVLAYQNIQKLNPFGKSDQPLNRLAYLALKPKHEVNGPIRLSSLTPGTSFRLTRSVGNYKERAIIFRLLYEHSDFVEVEFSWRALMKGNNQVGEESWKNTVDAYIKDGHKLLRPDLASRFKERLKNLSFSQHDLPRTYNYLQKQYDSFYDALIALLRKLTYDTAQDALHFSYEIIINLRKVLTKECITYLNADLFILDEFQRFNTLLDNDHDSESNQIAQAVLHDDETKVILLSATPFKPYTTHIDQLRGDSHNEELKKIVKYLGGTKGKELWLDFKRDQEAFFKILRNPNAILQNKELAKEKKHSLEKTFKKFLSRNERISVAEDYNDMTENNLEAITDIVYGDVKNFVTLDRLAQLLASYKKKGRNTFGSLLELSKSAPYPLSFLQGYKLKDSLDEHRHLPEVQQYLLSNKDAFLSYDKINNYKPVGNNMESNYPNGKFRVLLNEIFKNNGEFLLWVPPSMPRYKLFGPYAKSKEFSKILLFSGWQMAPRAIATLLSYEVERKTIGVEKDQAPKDEDVAYNYFESPRRPRPNLRYARRDRGGTVTYNTWMFNLTYPSRTLLENNSLRSSGNSKLSFTSILTEQAARIEECFKTLHVLEQFEDKSKPVDPTWYWLSAPLLDSLTDKKFKVKDVIIRLTDKSDENSGRVRHREHLEKTLKEVISKSRTLGRIPRNLYRVLAEITLASPANAAALALYNNFEVNQNCKAPNELFENAYRIAEAFVSLFNKPESISVVRHCMKKQKEQWRKVLRYCFSGGITDMLEEYIYLLKECNGLDSMSEIADELTNVLTVRTSSVNVELFNKTSYETHAMRCHFALSYGDQKIKSESGSNRMVNIRNIFNSPFRPFVLASTSIGQEGLDFHFYCRKIFHWNLPHNAIDLEQREGRINRYKGLVIRKKLIESLEDEAIFLDNPKSIWKRIFKLGEKKYADDKSGIKPYWYLDDGESNIERFVPYHPLSKDLIKYEQLTTTLGLYRLTFGQPRQEELVKALSGLEISEEEMEELRKSLLIN